MHKKYLALGLTLVGIGIGALAVDNLVTFNAGSTIKSSEVNQNFSSLRTATANLEAFKDAILANGCKPGEAVASIEPNGKVNCIAVGGGTGGTTYTAGSGLALNGNQFSVANAGVDGVKLADGAVGASKIADGAVGASKIADGAVGASKIADGAVGLTKLSPAGGSNGQVLKLVGGAISWATDATSGGGTGGLTSVNVASPLSGDGTSGSPIGIADGALLGSKLANSTVSIGKLDSDLNQRFKTVGELDLFKTTILSNGCKAGEAIASLETTGKVNCIAVGSSYTAGAGLSLSGNKFSIADGGVGSPQIGNGAVLLSKLDVLGTSGSGKFLGFNGGKLEWQTPASSSSTVQTDTTLKGDGSSGNKLGIKIPLVVNENTGNPLMQILNEGSGTNIYTSSNNGFGIVADSLKGIAVRGGSTSNFGVFGFTSSSAINTSGVFGVNYSNTGQVVGVLGQGTSSPIGTGVGGFGSVTGGYFEAKSGPAGGFNPTGVYGVARDEKGAGVRGTSTNGTGAEFDGGTFGMVAQGIGQGSAIFGKNNSSASTLILNQGGSGRLISGTMGSNFFRVESNGDIHTSGNLTAKGNLYASDRNAKTNFKPINPQAVLDKVATLPLSRWNYKSDAAGVQHIGPMAQDFHAAFGLNGSDQKHISAVDVQGVALAAIQGLNQKLEAKETRIAQLEEMLSRLEARLAKLEKQ